MTDVIDARTIVVLADCHIHPGGGIDWPPDALEAFRGATLIITLGDMGESSGLDALEAIAPVLGVRGVDDEEDPRTGHKLFALVCHEAKMGLVFDPVEAGLADGKEPLGDISPERLAEVFKMVPDVLLWASTHVPSVERAGGLLRVNPGSATLPDKGSARSFAKLTVGEGGVEAQIVSL